MGVKDIVKVTVDSNTLIYYFENHSDYAQDLEELFTRIEDGEIRAYISVLSILEILVKPKREKNELLENQYKALLSNYPNLDIVSIDMNIIDLAASIRAEHCTKSPDAIILSTAIASESKYLISNDIRLRGICDEKGLYLVTMEDLKNNKEEYFYST
jgi:predicted nucleic acid-binding protein